MFVTFKMGINISLILKEKLNGQKDCLFEPTLIIFFGIQVELCLVHNNFQT